MNRAPTIQSYRRPSRGWTILGLALLSWLAFAALIFVVWP